MNIYVGNLPWSIDDASLEQIFAEHGTITSAKVITDRQTNRSRGLGFVEMSDGPVRFFRLGWILDPTSWSLWSIWCSRSLEPPEYFNCSISLCWLAWIDWSHSNH